MSLVVTYWKPSNGLNRMRPPLWAVTCEFKPSPVASCCIYCFSVGYRLRDGRQGCRIADDDFGLLFKDLDILGRLRFQQGSWRQFRGLTGFLQDGKSKRSRHGKSAPADRTPGGTYSSAKECPGKRP